MGASILKSGAGDASILEVREVLFDFEGTLVDVQWQPQPAIEECLAALENAGFKRCWYGDTPTYSAIYNETLSLSRKGRGSANPQHDMVIIDAVYDKYDADAMTRWNLYSDTLETMLKLKETGFRMGVVSNVGAAALKPALHKLGLSDFFSVVISRDAVERLKPNPEGLVKAAAQLDIAPANVILIGDSRDDVVAARRAGMLACYLAGGQDPKEAMITNPADIEVTSLSQLPEFLCRKERPAVQ